MFEGSLPSLLTAFAGTSSTIQNISGMNNQVSINPNHIGVKCSLIVWGGGTLSHVTVCPTFVKNYIFYFLSVITKAVSNGDICFILPGQHRRFLLIFASLGLIPPPPSPKYKKVKLYLIL